MTIFTLSSLKNLIFFFNKFKEFSLKSPDDEIEVHCFYDGAPEYRIELRAPDFKTAEDTWRDSIKAVVSVIEAAGGTADSYRE